MYEPNQQKLREKWQSQMDEVDKLKNQITTRQDVENYVRMLVIADRDLFQMYCNNNIDRETFEEVFESRYDDIKYSADHSTAPDTEMNFQRDYLEVIVHELARTTSRQFKLFITKLIKNTRQTKSSLRDENADGAFVYAEKCRQKSIGDK